MVGISEVLFFELEMFKTCVLFLVAGVVVVPKYTSIGWMTVLVFETFTPKMLELLTVRSSVKYHE